MNSIVCYEKQLFVLLSKFNSPLIYVFNTDDGKYICTINMDHGHIEHAIISISADGKKLFVSLMYRPIIFVVDIVGGDTIIELIHRVLVI